MKRHPQLTRCLFMSSETSTFKIPIDGFSIAILAMVLVATLVPASGVFAQILDVSTDVCVGLLFFLYGARLSREDIFGGLTHWKLHLVVLASTYALFPVLVLAMKPLLAPIVDPRLLIGVLFLATLPSTVQSSIAFTSIAGGNVAAAVCAASLSSLLGVLFTPALVSLLIDMEGSMDFITSASKIMMQILAPFVVGHLMRPLIGGWVVRNKPWLTYVDRGAIILIVYVAFSASVIEGLWQDIGWSAIFAAFIISSVLLALVLFLTRAIARSLGFSREDEITTVFCGSKKSLAAGMPMAKVLFAGVPSIGAIIFPLMLFHQIQLMVCAFIAAKYAESNPEKPGSEHF